MKKEIGGDFYIIKKENKREKKWEKYLIDKNI
jgi:hypothetical protein